MTQQNDSDGWYEQSPDQFITEESTFVANNRRESALSILKSTQHSLMPDMLFGWKPKLPSCPLPLSYSNPYVESLLKHIPTDDRFSIAYLGHRFVNSVQVNQQYGYHWRYRERYSLNLALIKEAVEKIGGERRNVPVKDCEYKFDGQFQSGNLDLAVRIKKNQYDLFLRSDTNTKGHTSWYYFSVSNGSNIGEVQLNICNFGKSKNLYSKGMRPFVMIEGEKGEWTQDHCFDVCFVERLCRFGFERKAWQLQWKFNFTKKNMKVFFAYSIPYTYSKLEGFISDIQLNYPKLVKCKKLCQSLGGLSVPLLTIGSFNEGQENTHSQDSPPTSSSFKKRALLITARIHPGQSNSSYLLQGFIRALLSGQPSSTLLLNSFDFYVIPMLNPDGVVVGNFRTSYSGKDLNRQFNRLNKFVFPEVTHLHELALNLKRGYRSGFEVYFDFHGHSSKKGLFCYGPEHPASRIEFFKSRALAKIIQQMDPIFSYRKSIFTINQHKKSTGRAHMLWKIKIPMTFTFEISNGLYQSKESKNIFLDRSTILKAGASILRGFYRYAQLQMKIPSHLIKAKVDTGMKSIKKRSLHSSKSVRAGSNKTKVTTLKQIIKNDETFNPTKTQHIKSKMQLNNTIDIAQNDEGRQQFIKMMKEIKKQIVEVKQEQQYEGGSDSQGSSQDLSAEELTDLYRLIQTKNDNRQYNKSLDWKLKNSASKLPRKAELSALDEGVTRISTGKAIKSSKYLQNRKLYQMPPKSTKRQNYQPQPIIQKAVLLPKNFAVQF